MARDYDQLTFFGLTACEELEHVQGLPPEKTAPNVPAESGPPVPANSVSAPEGEVFRAVSPLASISLREVCAACGHDISGRGFVILDYEELGTFCDQDCADKCFRSYLYEAPEDGRF
jgi:hypothetical protein